MTEEQAKTRVDPELKKKMDRHPDSIADILREGAKMYMGGTDKRELKDELRTAEDEFDHANRKCKTWVKRREEHLEKVHRLARDLHEFTDPKEEYEEWLGELLDDREQDDTGFLIPPIIKNRDGFNRWDKTPNEVQYDLKKLAVEQERELTAYEFTEGGGGSTRLKSVSIGHRYLYERYKINDEDELEERDKDEIKELSEERRERRSKDAAYSKVTSEQ